MWTASFSSASIMATARCSCSMRRFRAASSKAQAPCVYAQTMAFTTLMMFQIFNVFNARSDEQSAFRIFSKYLVMERPCRVARPPGRRHLHPLSTAGILDREPESGDWLLCAAVASSVLWLRELSKLFTRATAT